MALSAFAALGRAGCGAGPMVAQPRPVAEDVRSLRISSGIDVRVHHAARPGVVVHAGRAVIGRVVTQSQGDVLRIAIRDRGIVIGSDPLANVSIDVSLPRLDDVLVDGSADVRLDRYEAGHALDADATADRVAWLTERLSLEEIPEKLVAEVGLPDATTLIP